VEAAACASDGGPYIDPEGLYLAGRLVVRDVLDGRGPLRHSCHLRGERGRAEEEERKCAQ